MEPAHGRRLFRPALTLWVAPPLLLAVAVWGESAWARSYYAFVLVTATVLAAVSLRS